ncbi:tRNA pseudouridine(13) synthase TruD [Halomonas sp. WWR20]
MTNTSSWPPDWPRAHGAVLGTGDYRGVAEDFVVEELLDFTPEGQGEHLWLWVEKRDLTTLELVKRLARASEVQNRDVGYSGLKDRTAVTRQWLSVHLPGREAPEDLAARLGDTPVRLLEQVRHPRKLKRGVHRANRFELRITGDAVAHAQFAARWQRLCEDGVPNYFGPQRFGTDGRNLSRAAALLAKGWRKRDDPQGLMLSTARSFLFNELLAARVANGTWASPLPGEALNLDGSSSRFAAPEVDATLRERARQLDVHPTGMLWGSGPLESEGEAAEIEAAIARRHAPLAEGLERAGVRMDRRPLRLRLAAPVMQCDAHQARLSFQLPRGGFATSVLRELMMHPSL